MLLLLLVIAVLPGRLSGYVCDINEDTPAAKFPLGSLAAKAFPLIYSSLLRVDEVTPGGPAATAGLQVGDFIYGANNQRLPVTGYVHDEAWKGAVSELGYAIERSESTTGAISLQILRPGTGALTLNARLPVTPAWRPSFPVGDPRMQAYFDKVCADIHTKVQDPNFYLTINSTNDISTYYTGPFLGLILLASPNWNDTTGPAPYRLSINKIKTNAIALLNSRPMIALLPSDPNYINTGRDNWHLTASAMYLAEYRRKTGDASVAADIQRAAVQIASRINSSSGLMVHGGIDPLNGYDGGGGLNIINAHAMLCMGMLKGAGANFNAPVGTSGLTVEQLYQTNWTRLKGTLDLTVGATDEGNLGYGGVQVLRGPGCPGGWDSNARTPAAAVGYLLYLAAGGTAPTTQDTDRLNRMKGYTPRNWQRQHNGHAYSLGTVFSQMLLPFVTDREQNYFRENNRFLLTMSRDHTGEVLYFPGRANVAGDGYLGLDKVVYLMPGFAWAIASGNLPSFPKAANATSRIFVRMNSPRNDWPQLAARHVRTESTVLDLDLDVTDYQGNVLASGYTAAWSLISGPGTVSFSSPASPDTRVTFPGCGDYRLRLTVTAGSYSLTEDYDFEIPIVGTVGNPPEIFQQPVSRTAVPGGCADFTTVVSGDGPFLYEWKTNGTTVSTSIDPTLHLTNLSAGQAGSYQCTILYPGGQLVSAPANLRISGASSVHRGGLKREVWYNTSGVNVADLTGRATYPLCPDTTGMVLAAEAPRNVGVLYGQRLSGWVVAPTSGTYTFYIASDDAGQLWLSRTADPNDKIKIAEITSFAGFRGYSAGASSSVTLQAGQRYYIEALQINGGGALDHLSIAWRRPGTGVPADGSAPIPGEFLEYEKVTVDPEADGLVSRWTFDEGGNAAVWDLMGTGNDGILSGAERAPGKFGGGVLFDTTDKLVLSNAGSLGGLTPFTVAAWVKVNAGNNTQGVIVQQRDSTGFDGQYVLTVRANGKAGFFCYGDGNTQFDFTGATSINDGNWHHVAAMRDAVGGARIYVDGLLDGSVIGTIQRNLSASIGIGIGADIRDNNLNFRGVIDEVRIYNRDITPSQVSALAATGDWSTTAWTNDSSIGLRPYTLWAYHFGSSALASIGGKIVSGIAGANPTNPDFDITGVGSVFNGDTNALTSLSGSASSVIAHDFIYGGTPASITLKNLTPGYRYVATILSVGWEAAGGRQMIVSSGGDSRVVDQDEFGDNNGLALTYTWQQPAGATARVIAIGPAPGTVGTFHLYGLALRHEGILVTSVADSGAGSLRDALATAATSTYDDSIVFDPALNGRTIILSSEIVYGGTGKTTVDATDLPNGVTISGGNVTRLFYLWNGGNLTLRSLNLTEGNGAGTALTNFGGAIINNGGTLTLERCTFFGNAAVTGGAVYSSTANITGPITSSTTLSQCTLHDNLATLSGGAIQNNNGQTLLQHCTVSCNSAPSGSGGGVGSFGDTRTRTVVQFSIVAGNTSGDVDLVSGATNSVLSLGGNVIGTGTGVAGFTLPTDLRNVSAAALRLSPLGEFGGPTYTMALLPGSPARNAANGSSIAADQRGFPIIGIPDAGAYESGTLADYNTLIWETLPATATIWEHAADSDFDGDGASNWDEFIAGTNVGDSTNYLRVTQVVLNSGSLYFTFPTVAGRKYSFEITDNLALPNWTPFGAILTGTGGLITLPPIGPISGTPRLFFRIRAAP